MWLSKQAGELVQRATCHFKPATYFLHTHAPFPSILLLLPARAHRLTPLVNRLLDQQNFSLAQQLQTVKGSPSSDDEVGSGKAAESSFESIYGIPFNQSTSFICSNPQGVLQLTKTPANKGGILAVILFSTVEDQQVRCLSSRNYENIVIMLKLTALLSIICLFNQLKYSTRAENQSNRT